jgi:hypothetical protein
VTEAELDAFLWVVRQAMLMIVREIEKRHAEYQKRARQ